MDVSNKTGQNTGYRVLGAGGWQPGQNTGYRVLGAGGWQPEQPITRQRARLSTFGTPEAVQEDLRAEQDIREGRHETFSSVEEFARQLPDRLQEVRKEISAGPLAPGEVEAVWPSPRPFRVVFRVEGLEVASATFFKEPTVVRLVEDELGFRVEAEARRA